MVDEAELFRLPDAGGGTGWLVLEHDFWHGARAIARAFWDWELERIAGVSETDREALLGVARIIRNRRKIEATIGNAAAVLALYADRTLAGRGRLGLCRAVGAANRGGRCARANRRLAGAQPRTQATRLPLHRPPPPATPSCRPAGIVNDHLVDCFRHDAVEALRRPRLDARIHQ